jgi:hypothetical protein
MAATFAYSAFFYCNNFYSLAAFSSAIAFSFKAFSLAIAFSYKAF